jgi:hypothetical protein
MAVKDQIFRNPGLGWLAYFLWQSLFVIFATLDYQTRISILKINFNYIFI